MRIFIPAKGTSTRVRNKNLQHIVPGKSLVQWTIENYRRWFPGDEIHVATDSSEIKRIAVQQGCQLYGLAGGDIYDTRDASDLLEEFISVYPGQPVLLAQCTSPITFEVDVKAAVATGKAVAMSAIRTVLHTPETAQTLSQHIPETTIITGNFLIVRDRTLPVAAWYDRAHLVDVNPLSAIDINTPADLARARWLLSRISQTDLDHVQRPYFG